MRSLHLHPSAAISNDIVNLLSVLDSKAYWYEDSTVALARRVQDALHSEPFVRMTELNPSLQGVSERMSTLLAEFLPIRDLALSSPGARFGVWDTAFANPVIAHRDWLQEELHSSLHNLFSSACRINNRHAPSKKASEFINLQLDMIRQEIPALSSAAENLLGVGVKESLSKVQLSQLALNVGVPLQMLFDHRNFEENGISLKDVAALLSPIQFSALVTLRKINKPFCFYRESGGSKSHFEDLKAVRELRLAIRQVENVISPL